MRTTRHPKWAVTGLALALLVALLYQLLSGC
jgi:hypothetical protein